jgi:histidyl-tRNA synthetase
VRTGLDAAGVTYVLDPRLVRGLDYYTRTAFEWVSDVLAANKAGSVNAGGRYDGLAETLGGTATPGVGFAMGLDRVLLAMEGEGLAPPDARTPRTFVVAVGPGAAAAGGRLVAELRSAEVPAVAAFEDRPLKAQMKMADRSGAASVAIIGERELDDGTVTLRRLADGFQTTVAASDAVRWLSRIEEWAP